MRRKVLQTFSISLSLWRFAGINQRRVLRAAIEAPRTVFSATSGTVLRHATIPVRVVRTIQMHGSCRRSTES